MGFKQVVENACTFTSWPRHDIVWAFFVDREQDKLADDAKRRMKVRHQTETILWHRYNFTKKINLTQTNFPDSADLVPSYLKNWVGSISLLEFFLEKFGQHCLHLYLFSLANFWSLFFSGMSFVAEIGQYCFQICLFIHYWPIFSQYCFQMCQFVSLFECVFTPYLLNACINPYKQDKYVLSAGWEHCSWEKCYIPVT